MIAQLIHQKTQDPSTLKDSQQGGRPDVGEDGVIEEDCVLGHHSHARPQRLLSDIPQVLAVNPDAACCGVVKAEQQPQAG